MTEFDPACRRCARLAQFLAEGRERNRVLAAQLHQHGLVRPLVLVVFDERPERCIVLVADGRLERDGLLCDLEDVGDAGRRRLEVLCELFPRADIFRGINPWSWYIANTAS